MPMAADVTLQCNLKITYMNTIMKFSAVIFLLGFAATLNSVVAQDNNQPTGKSYVKIKSMKIINGDTIVTEKEYTGDGNIQIEDSLGGQDFGNFSFHSFSNPFDSSFFKNYSNMDNMFRDFNFGGNDLFFKGFDSPEFMMPHFDFDVDSMIKEFNFRNTDTAFFPDLKDNKIIIKSFKDEDIKKLSDSLNKAHPSMDVQIFGKNDKGQPVTYNKKIMIIDKADNTSKVRNEELKIEVFPNPADGFFNVSFQLDPKNKTSILITDMNGKELLKETMEKASGIYTRQFDLKDYAKGNYLINIKQGKKSVSRQIIIE
jgi:hypothetical protein